MQRTLTIAVILAMAGGCSIIAVRPSPWIDAEGQQACTSWAAPAADAAGAVAMTFVGRGLQGFGDALSDCNSRGDCNHSFGFYVPALILAGSAIYGFVGNGLCTSRLPPAPPSSTRL